MSKKSNSALEKFNKETPESVTRKAYKQMIDDEFNDARKQVIRRQFDQVGLYNEIFDKNRISMGNTLVEIELADLFRKYLESIKTAEFQLQGRKQQPFDGVIASYTLYANKLASYVQGTSQQVDVKAWTDALRNSAPELQKLFADGVNRLGVGNVELVSKGSDDKLVAPKVEKFLSVTEPKWKQEERALDALQESGIPVTSENIEKALESLYGRPNNSAQSGLPSIAEQYPTEKDLINLFLLIEKVSVGFIQGPLQGYDTLSAEQKKNLKAKIGLFKDEFRNLGIQKETDLARVNLVVNRVNQPGAIRNRAEYDFAIANLELLKKETIENIQQRNAKALGVNRPQEPLELAEVAKYFDDAIEQIKSNWVSKLPVLDNLEAEMAQIQQFVDDLRRRRGRQPQAPNLPEQNPERNITYPEEPPAVGPPRRGRPPKAGVPDRPVQGPAEGTIYLQPEEGQAPPPRRGRPTKGGPTEQAPAQLSDADKIKFFGQWFSTLTQAQKEALPVFDDVDHAYRFALENRAFEGFGKKRGKGKTSLSISDMFWIMKALGGGKAHGRAHGGRANGLLWLMKNLGLGRAHGGQAGFSMDKTREIVDQWPNFPYYVPPASKTGPMLTNPRSRVHIPTEGNGKPKRGRPAKGGILPVVALVGKQIAKQAVKEGVKHGVKSLSEGKLSHNTDTTGFLSNPKSSPEVNSYYCNTRRRQGIKDPACGGAVPLVLTSPEVNSYYCLQRKRQGIKDPICGGAKKKAKKRGKPSYDEI
jgi:hypothetical protein